MAYGIRRRTGGTDPRPAGRRSGDDEKRFLAKKADTEERGALFQLRVGHGGRRGIPGRERERGDCLAACHPLLPRSAGSRAPLGELGVGQVREFPADAGFGPGEQRNSGWR
jgi:hypothetical protein